MLRGLRERGIEPMVTLMHFTLPLWFAEQGGWEQPRAPEIFARFVERVVPSLEEFTPSWCTLNEPLAWVYATYVTGGWPPGRRSVRGALVAATQLARAHAAAYRVIHQIQPQAQVGFANYFRLFDPQDPRSRLDRLVAGRQDRFLNWSFVDALTSGRVRAFPWLVDLPEAAGTLDFLGVNYYTRDLVAFDFFRPHHLFGRNFHASDASMSDAGYGEIYPEGLYRVLRLAHRYGLPMRVTENGLPDADDDQRPRFILSHLQQVWRALRAGIPVNGYYHWSLIDNFEWADGWSLKFGLIEVDPATQRRTPRPSAHLYAKIAAEGRITREMVDRFA
jgi:beta-glucosidase